MKWTLVRYRAKPDQADENQRLSAAVFGELQQKAPAGLHYAVFRLPDDTFVHLASLEDGATPCRPRNVPRLLRRRSRALRHTARGRPADHRRQLWNAGPGKIS
jgi:hypothetical protein